jgi:hypothetical protein
MLLAQREILSLVRLPVPPLQLHRDSSSGKAHWQGMSGDLARLKGVYSEGGITELCIEQIHDGPSRGVRQFNASLAKSRVCVNVRGRPTFPRPAHRVLESLPDQCREPADPASLLCTRKVGRGRLTISSGCLASLSAAFWRSFSHGAVSLIESARSWRCKDLRPTCFSQQFCC